MNKLYNNQEEITSKIQDFLLKIDPSMRKTQLKILPSVILGIILSESCVASKIANKLKGDFSLVQHSSVIKRIRRFFKNKLFNPYKFYDKVITYVIDTYTKKHNDKRVHIVFDHMFSNDNYTVFMITMRVGKQGIPLWFRCFLKKDDPDAFKEKMIIEGIDYVSNLFKNKDLDLIFLADRWFNSISLLKHIADLGHTYCVRLKKNMKIFYYDKKEGHYVWKWIYDLKAYQCHSECYDVYLTGAKLKTKIVFSEKRGHEEPWIIVTNGSYKHTIMDYGYRFGAIESVFKNQKSNGFYLEDTVKASLKYFESLYTLNCFAILYMTLLGSDFAKNTKCYKDTKIQTHTMINGKKVRVMSLFRTGLTLFHLAYESSRYIRLPVTLKFYDS